MPRAAEHGEVIPARRSAKSKGDDAAPSATTKPTQGLAATLALSVSLW